MKETPAPLSGEPRAASREELELFLQTLTHEIRNRLSGIALEAADLAEQSAPQLDASRLQQQVQDCSAFLKRVRELLMAAGPGIDAIPLVEVTRKLKDRTL